MGARRPASAGVARILSALLILNMACATESLGARADLAPAGTVVPLINPPRTWDDAFNQMVNRCHDRESGGPSLTGDVAFTVGWVALSLGIGALIFTSKQVDDATVLAASVGVVAGAGEIFTVVRGVQGRDEAIHAIEEQRRDWRAQWAAALPPQRTLLLQAVADSCGEQDTLAQDQTLLGPLPPPPAEPMDKQTDGGAE